MLVTKPITGDGAPGGRPGTSSRLSGRVTSLASRGLDAFHEGFPDSLDVAGGDGGSAPTHPLRQLLTYSRAKRNHLPGVHGTLGRAGIRPRPRMGRDPRR
jgi:hypothetical protein